MQRRLAANWQDIHLTENFKLGEFVVSKEFPEIAAKITPTIEQTNSLYWLCKFAMEPIRKEYGPVMITSGLVNEELNEARGSKQPNSQHLFGEACDFIIQNVSMLDPYIFCKAEMEWKGELIYYKKRGHVHIALESLWNTPDQFINEED